MNTPAHLIVGTAVFGKPHGRGTYLAALAGAMTPDLSLYVMVAVSIWVMGISPRVVFGEYYYSDAWQAVFAVDNSFVLWGVLFAVAVWRGMPRLFAFAGAALLHIALDFPLHTHDARMHFWPLTNWVFESPISYWDTGAYAGVVGPLELVLSVLCAVYLWRRFHDIWVRSATAILMVMEVLSTGIWRFFF
ncbi:MAG: cobalamin biosynthesis protein CobQ [Pseudomonadota bacterium]